MLEQNKKTWAVLTSGGDAPGMNAAIYGFVSEALFHGHKVLGIKEGYQGLIENQFLSLDLLQTTQFVHQAGSFLGSARSLEFQNFPEKRQKCLENLQKNNVSGLFVIGGNGSYLGAERLANLGLQVACAPGTIDNDVSSSAYTIGFFSAMQAIFDGIKSVRATAATHQQIVLIEVMGRHCPDLALFGGLAGVVDAIVTNDNPFSLNDFLSVVQAAKTKGKREVIILVTENIYGSKEFNFPSLNEVAVWLEKNSSYKARSMSLSYLQRGAVPTAWEVYQSYQFGRNAFLQFLKSKDSFAIGFDGINWSYVPLKIANQMPRIERKDDLEKYNSLIFTKKANNH